MTEHPGYELMRQTPGAELSSMTAFRPGWGFELKLCLASEESLPPTLSPFVSYHPKLLF